VHGALLSSLCFCAPSRFIEVPNGLPPNFRDVETEPKRPRSQEARQHVVTDRSLTRAGSSQPANSRRHDPRRWGEWIRMAAFLIDPVSGGSCVWRLVVRPCPAERPAGEDRKVSSALQCIRCRSTETCSSGRSFYFALRDVPEFSKSEVGIEAGVLSMALEEPTGRYLRRPQGGEPQVTALPPGTW
jgi:hypothetical protein